MEFDPQYGRANKKSTWQCMYLICQNCALLFKGFEHPDSGMWRLEARSEKQSHVGSWILYNPGYLSSELKNLVWTEPNNTSLWQIEAGLLQIQGLTWTTDEYKISLDNSVRSCLKIKSQRYWGDNSVGQCFACRAQVLPDARHCQQGTDVRQRGEG